MKNVIACLFFFVVSSMCYAQDYTIDVVYLKNGSVIRGQIIEQVPNQSLKITTADGSVFVCDIADVEKMTKERPLLADNREGSYKKNEKGNAKPFRKSKLRGYKGFVDTGATFASDGGSNIEISTVHGYQFNDYIFLGGGTALQHHYDLEDYGIPVFADLKVNFTNRKIAPFGELRVGYSYGQIEGSYMCLAVGVRFGLANRLAINLSAGYSYREDDYYYNYYYDGYSSNYYSSNGINGMNLRVGFEF